MKFNEMIKNRRLEAGLTVRKLAEQIGCSPSYLSEVENGLKPAPKSEEIINNISRVLLLPSEQLKKAVAIDSMSKNPERLKSIFSQEPELAASFYRVSESMSDDELIDMFKELVHKKTGGDNYGE